MGTDLMVMDTEGQARRLASAMGHPAVEEDERRVRQNFGVVPGIGFVEDDVRRRAFFNRLLSQEAAGGGGGGGEGAGGLAAGSPQGSDLAPDLAAAQDV